MKLSRAHRYVGEPGVLDYLVVHATKRDECEALAKHFGMRMEVTGHPIDEDNVKRLNRALHDKTQQLPPSRPGVIIVFGNYMLFESSGAFYDGLVYNVEETIYDHDNLVAAVLITEGGAFGESDAYKTPRYTVVRKATGGVIDETVLVLRNRYSEFSNLASVGVVLNVFAH